MARRSSGYSLYELLVTTSVVAILVAIGIPSFEAMLARQRQLVEVNALFHAMHLARKESIVRRRVVSICPSRDGLQCLADTDWSVGWLMFENRDRDAPPRVDANESVLRRHAVHSSVVIKANRRAFTLRATYLRATNGTVVFCDAKNRVPPKGLVISHTGRPRVAVSTPRGAPYTCAD